MGIKDLNSFLKKKGVDCFYETEISSLSGHKIAVDALNWLYTYMSVAYKKEVYDKSFNIDEDISEEKVFTFLVYDFLEFMMKLAENNITPIIIWDGPCRVFKNQTVAERREKRSQDRKEAEELLEEIRETQTLRRIFIQDKISKWKAKIVASSRLSNKYIKRFKEIIRDLGIPSLVASADAEKLCAELNIEGHVVAVWSRDTDLYALGASNVITKFNEDTIEFVDVSKILLELNMNIETFRDFCIMCECDFNKRIKNLGPVRAFKMMSEHLSIDEAEKNYPQIDFSCLEYRECREYFTPNPSEINPEELKWSQEVFEAKAEQTLEKSNLKHLLILLRKKFKKLL